METEILEYQNQLHEYMKKVSPFTDWDFKGSNLNNLTRLLSYNTYNNLHIGRMTNNESFLDTSRLRQSIVSHSTTLNYVPQSRSSPIFKISVSIQCPDDPNYVRIPKYYKFRGNLFGQTIYFNVLNDYISMTSDIDNVFTFDNILVYAGDVVRENFTISGVNVDSGYTSYSNPLILQSPEIDVNSIDVTVNVVRTPNEDIKFNRVDTLFGLNSTSNIFFVRGIFDNNYMIEFGDGRFGRALSNGDKAIVRYISVPNIIIPAEISMAKTTNISGYDKIEVTDVELVSQGAERESNDSIRNVARKSFQSQYRVVSKDDYNVTIKRQFPNIHHVYAFGGEEIARYGEVIITLKPKNGEIVSNIIKRQIINYLKDMNIIINPTIIDPDIYHIGGDVVVSYKTGIDNDNIESEIRSKIVSNLSMIGEDIFTGFNTQIYQSDINNVISESHPSINGSSINLKIYKKWRPASNEKVNLRLDLKLQLSRKEMSSSLFNFWDGEKIALGRFFNRGDFIILGSIENDGTIVYSPNPVGTIDYDKGVVIIDFEFYSYEKYIEFGFILENDMITMSGISFAMFDSSNLNLELVPNV